jgi:hypothetical protein
MSQDGIRISQLSSAISVFGAFAGTVGADGQTNSQSDGAHGSRIARDEMARLSGFYPVTSTGGLVGSTTTANLVTESTGLAPYGIASTRYAQSGTP